MSQRSGEASSRELVLEAAEQLFASRGYAAVTLKDIAKQLGIKQASLYYHVPGGKEDLFVEVMVRHLERRRETLEQIIATGPPRLEDCLTQIATWLLTQPPLNISRLVRTDLPDLAPEKADQVDQAIRRCVLTPMEQFFGQYQEQLRGEAGFTAGMFLTAVESLHVVKQLGPLNQEQLIAGVIDLLLYGSLKQ
ncbi:TetR/AcrR family transcriptional regulator [Leptolyngbya sp. FACHB-261]|uniref:TetR/AcrR family transcriptional regulator n=1 Tax=Leptolyngbya sp. FACHB-261 TaxID=2692806 RepID=UPI0016821471|nr:TetR/AcrR family transcriptional regulator [Leptolyngbya sp. FACHB-261]MBD2101936.1 TetR/AcrR family transcriptional regulator [Leptolyngbya sp. FACHB-261]